MGSSGDRFREDAKKGLTDAPSAPSLDRDISEAEACGSRYFVLVLTIASDVLLNANVEVGVSADLA
jgi:hypothetical protein